MSGLAVSLLAHSPDPELTVASAARLCYSPVGVEELKVRISCGEAGKLIGKLLSMGHESALEHASFTFGVEGLSRAASHQLVRHRLASYSQQSQRYVKFDEVEAVTPPSIAAKSSLAAVYKDKLDEVWRFYERMVAEGIPAEDARYILPNAAATKIVMTMNARELRHFFSLRLCNRAQWEIRELAEAMLREAAKAAPLLFAGSGPGCVRGKCPEGDFTCGKAASVKKKLNVIRPPS